MITIGQFTPLHTWSPIMLKFIGKHPRISVAIAGAALVLVVEVPANWGAFHNYAIVQPPANYSATTDSSVCADGSPVQATAMNAADPNDLAFAWSCSGILYRWRMSTKSPAKAGDYPGGSFHPYPSASRPWCRVTNADQPDIVEYYRKVGKQACKTGLPVFTTHIDEPGVQSFRWSLRTAPANWSTLANGIPLCAEAYTPTDCITS